MSVEDNPKNLKLVRDTLQVTGYQTIEAETGEEGLRLAHERRPALILMDIQLSGISGIEALHRLRADPVTRPTPVIAITASVMTQDRTRIMAAGFDGFQGKPISVKQLLATVREILDKPWSRVVAERSRDAGPPPGPPPGWRSLPHYAAVGQLATSLVISG
jgi:CheY-like chemotaxis protein